MLDVKEIRKHFKIYDNNPNLVYLDSAATSLKPDFVINKMEEYYNNYGVNIHRGVYKLSYMATDYFDAARSKVAQFINSSEEEVVFTKNASDSLNMICLMLGDKILNENDEVLSSFLEHHSSVLPWMMMCKKKKASLKYIELSVDNRLTVDNFKKAISKQTKIACLTYVSNVLGYKTPMKEIIKVAHDNNILVIVDASQAVQHFKIDVKDLDCDVLCFSSHKMMGPTGLGVLYGKKKLLKVLDPLLYGGDMNEDVSPYHVEVKEIPYRFETGTPAIAEVIALTSAIEYLEKIGLDNIENHCNSLYSYAMEKLKDVKGITIYNNDSDEAIIAFNINGVHPHDAATIFDENNVCLRAGHHCAQLLTKHLKVSGTLRASFYIYNDYNDVDVFVETVKKAVSFFEQFGGI